MADCGRFKRDCDNMRVGLLGTARCKQQIGWGDALLPISVLVDGRNRKCAQCYQQARSLEQRCQEQLYEDTRFDVQTGFLTENFKEIGKWLGIGLLVALVIYLVFK